MRLIRTFHPVGQGAFYTERFCFGSEKFTIVYDCGSTTLSGKRLEKKITSSFTKGSQIDMLFISHFHADHINGIEFLKNHCEIKKVVIPLVENEAKALVKIVNFLNYGFMETGLIDSPEEYFGDQVVVIRISPDRTQNEGAEAFGSAPVNITEIESSRAFNSGTFFLPKAGVDWLFIPFNFEHDKRKNQFTHALEECDLPLSNINSIEDVINNKKTIKKAYSAVDGDLNSNSLVLISTKNSNGPIRCYERDSRYAFFYPHAWKMNCGCLYMGDIDLTNQKEPIVSYLKSNFSKAFSGIGTLQVPHHGSIHNFSKEILDDSIRCAILSYGSNNSYGHPSDHVINELLLNRVYPHFVTEESSSIVTQIIDWT